MAVIFDLFALIIEFVCVSSTVSPFGITDLIFFNNGTVSKNDRFKLINIDSINSEGFMYLDDPLNNNNPKVTKQMQYLHEIDINNNNTLITPPSGMRSAVPLGSVGGGIAFEMHTDGRFTDTLMYNNGPNAYPSNNWYKMDLNEMFFAININNSNNQTTRILRTQLLSKEEIKINLQHYAIQNLSYYGAYPVSRLTAKDKIWGNNFYINLTAFSTFCPYEYNLSSTPGVLFIMDLINNNDFEINTIDLLFNFPDNNIAFNNNIDHNNGFTINKNGFNQTSGNITIKSYQCTKTNDCIELNGVFKNSSNLQIMWNNFMNIDSDINTYKMNINDASTVQYSFISRNNITVSANSVTSIVFVFGYYFPYRTFVNEFIGQYYSNLFSSSINVTTFLYNNMNQIINNTKKWHELWYSNDYLTDYMKDTFVNSMTDIKRTSMYLYDGRWRQFEAFDCDQVNPPHVHFYRSLPTQIFFNKHEQSLVKLFTDKMIIYNSSTNKFGMELGMVSENFGGSCGDPGNMGKLDIPNGHPRADDNPVYIYDIYMNWKWDGNNNFNITKYYQYAKKAMLYAINASIPYSLPYRMVNTFDPYGIMGDLNSYNSIIYITSLYAMLEISTFMNDIYMINIIKNEINFSIGNLTKYLYNEKNKNFISFWCENGIYSNNTLQGDTLYGLLWSKILDIDIMSNNNYDLLSKFISHLQTENKWSLTEYGIMFNVNMTEQKINNGSTVNYTYHCDYGSDVAKNGFRDSDKWETFGLDSATLYLSLLNDTNVSYEYMQIVMNKYRLLYKDQWDYREASGVHYNDDSPIPTRPVCSSHYGKHLIFYSFILILNKQKYDTRNNYHKLSISPIKESRCFPVFLPISSFLLCHVDDITDDICYQIQILFGTLTLHEFIIYEKPLKLNNHHNDDNEYPLFMKQDETHIFCVF